MRLLLELEPESDPVWHYLNIQVSMLFEMLKRLFDCFLNEIIVIYPRLLNLLGIVLFSSMARNSLLSLNILTMSRIIG